jgi:hypothetical protein
MCFEWDVRNSYIGWKKERKYRIGESRNAFKEKYERNLSERKENGM